MPPLRFVLMVGIAVSGIQPTCFAFDLRSNGTDDRNICLKCNKWEQTFRSWKDKESTWITNMEKHLQYIDFFISVLKRKQEDLLNIMTEVSFVDKKTFLGDPISLFALLKRSAKIWPNVALLMHTLPVSFNLGEHDNRYKRIHNSYKNILPNIEDLCTGHRGLARLQQVYNLDYDDLADQKEVSVTDFLGFAKYHCNKGFFVRCQGWLDMIAKKIKPSDLDHTSQEDFLQLYFLSSCLNGNQTKANIIFQELIDRKSTFPSLSVTNPDSRIFLESLIKEILHYGCDDTKEEREHGLKLHMKSLNKFNESDERFIAWRNLNSDDPRLLDICREPAVYNATARRLKCRYVHYNKAQLRIGPFKMEEFHIDPPILMFHNVISDTEISEMMNYGRKRMRKATVHYQGTNKVDVNYRTNEQDWIPDEDLPLSRTLSQRVAQFSGWDLGMSEPNQLASYSPAGEFKPHVDALSEENAKLVPDFADFSVVMFYLNDVTAGGHTIFPALNVSLVPTKGSAALWFNRKPDGSPDEDSLHAGCPVMRGYKWVINKWFHVATQDFPKCTNKKNSSFRYFYL